MRTSHQSAVHASAVARVERQAAWHSWSAEPWEARPWGDGVGRLLGIVAVALGLAAAPALAATITVTTTDQSSTTACTLTDAILAANSDEPSNACPAGSGADTIELAPGATYVLTSSYDGEDGLPVITSTITIQGHGAAVRRESESEFRIFRVADASAVVTINDLTVSGGAISGIVGAGGANVSVLSGVLTLNRSTISGGTADGFRAGGGLYNGGGTLNVNDSTISGNLAGGGLAVFSGITNVSNSTVSGNVSHAPGGGGIVVSGILTVNDSTISGNVNDGLFNSAGSGSGLYVVNEGSSATLRRTIVSGNIGNLADREILVVSGGVVMGNGHNIIGHDDSAATSGFTPSGTDIVPVETLAEILGPLANNGGPTHTHELPQDSPAIDAVPTADCPPPATDQRGVVRPQGAACDAGAFEREALFTFTGFLNPVDNPPTENFVKAGSGVPVKFQLGGDQGLDILAPGSPTSQEFRCESGAVLDPIATTSTAGNSGLSYDGATQTYTYVWKTNKSWAKTCREFVVTLVDGTTHTARFRFW